MVSLAENAEMGPLRRSHLLLGVNKVLLSSWHRNSETQANRNRWTSTGGLDRLCGAQELGKAQVVKLLEACVLAAGVRFIGQKR